MFRKKHSDINIKIGIQTYSPLRPKHQRHSPLANIQQPKNLSPMKNRNRTPNTRSPRHQFLPATPYKSPCHRQNTFEGKFESLGTDLHSRQGSARPSATSKYGYGTEQAQEPTSFWGTSKVSKQNGSQRTMKESKKLFTKCISEMNSEKRRSELDTSNTVSGAPSECKSSNKKEGGKTTTTSFRALKVQMIESVLPEDRPTPEKKFSPFEAIRLRSQSNRPEFAVEEERIENSPQAEIKVFEVQESEKQESVIELINQSFSNAPVSQLEIQAKLMESIYEAEESDYKDFDDLIKNVDFQSNRYHGPSDEISVRASVETVKSQFNFDLIQ